MMIREKQISLDPRLSMIAEMVGRCEVYADIGCDHGRLGAFLLQRGWVGQAIQMDVSGPSLEKARGLMQLLGLSERARFLVSDGADALDCPVDVAVIAGMGGATAAGIVERGRVRLGNARLILQANVAVPELRRRLSGAGYVISDERIVKDGRRYYMILGATPGASSYSEAELHIGPVLMRTRPAELAGYGQFRLRVAQRALEGARSGREAETVAELEAELRIWEEVESWL